MAMARANMANQVSKPPMKRPKSKMKAFDEYRKKNGTFHPADPRNPMNAESTNPRPRGMKHGGATCRGMGAATQGGNFKVS